ncbi:MAG: LON peptidase substrate-binding domain-containing protein [Actinomycetota bacterium]|jgi:Lon protease-like protein|nr:LON peptidase substrate-binding domain-containing protein [Actinomycetota bacterium]
MAADRHDRLPLFPLGLVLFPGLVLPLHVFEERYRVLVRELLARPADQRRFGVVAIREGREVGADGVRALHEVGCVARLERAEPHPDGRFDVVTVGAERFRLHGLAEGRPYLLGEVELLPDALGDADEAAVLRRAVAASYRAYLHDLGEAGGEAVDLDALPDEPTVLSYLVAATVLVDLADRQALLEQPDTLARLGAELALLRRERVLLGTLGAVPAPELTRAPLSPN